MSLVIQKSSVQLIHPQALRQETELEQAVAADLRENQTPEDPDRLIAQATKEEGKLDEQGHPKGEDCPAPPADQQKI